MLIILKDFYFDLFLALVLKYQVICKGSILFRSNLTTKTL